jgi:TetR/AcrR family transcriptional repressor of nem operon
MPRKPQYNLDAVLSQAIDVFLEHGYHGAIMDEIIARTDFNRRGFYIEFGSKQTFFYMVLQHYKIAHLNKILDNLGFNDQKVQEIGRHYLDRLQINFISCLEKAQYLGQVQPYINIESTALQLTSYVQGFAVNAILAGHTDELQLATQALLGPLTVRQ